MQTHTVTCSTKKCDTQIKVSNSIDKKEKHKCWKCLNDDVTDIVTQNELIKKQKEAENKVETTKKTKAKRKTSTKQSRDVITSYGLNVSNQGRYLNNTKKKVGYTQQMIMDLCKDGTDKTMEELKNYAMENYGKHYTEDNVDRKLFRQMSDWCYGKVAIYNKKTKTVSFL